MGVLHSIYLYICSAGQNVTLNIFPTIQNEKVLYLYSSPSLSGHSQQRPPSLMWPQIFGTSTVLTLTSPSRQRPPL